MGTFPHDSIPTALTEDAEAAQYLEDELVIVRRLQIFGNDIDWIGGAGTPEGVVTANVGSFFSRTDGGAATTWYVKESGTGNTGWVAK